MLVELNNVRSFVLDATEDEHRWLTEYLTWPDSGAHWRRKRGYGGDGYVRLYDRADDSFPAGFTGMVAQQSAAVGHQVRVSDARVAPAKPTTYTAPWLRPYQAEAVEKGLRRTRGVLWAATGAGKTEVMIATVLAAPVRWLLLVHRTQLGLQARDRFKLRTGGDAGVVAEGVFAPHPGPHGLTVATFQTLGSMARTGDKRVAAFLASVQGVLVDECHTLPADSFRWVLDHLPEAYWRIGVSGTPLARGDRKTMHLFGCLGSVYHRVTAQELIEAGVLARPRIRMVRAPEVPPSEKVTFQGVYNELVVKNRRRSELVAAIARKAAKPCIVFVKAVDHGRDLEKRIRRAGLQVDYVDGSTSTSTRQSSIARLERGDVDVLVASVVFNEGVDIPNLASVVVAAGGSSAISALQRVGRGTRRVAGKSEFEVWDLDDVGHKWVEGHSAERVRAYRVEEYEVLRSTLDPVSLQITDEPYP